MSDIAAWLENLDLGRYQEVFAANEIDLEVLPELNEQDFKDLDIPLGPRRKLLKAIKTLSDAVVDTHDQSAQSEAPPSQAERRQLTVMFVDLVGSTALSSQLDPEDLSTIMRRYQNTVAGVISRYGGYVAKYMGDGILAYFGWPRVHEDEAKRALRAALEIVAAMQPLNADQSLPGGVELAVRIGLATGVVVVGDLIGEGSAQEHNVVGETPNLAARLQDLARHNGIVIGSLTKDLAGDDFLYDDLGVHELKGIAGQVKAWGVVAAQEASADREPLRKPDVPIMVGRQEELGLLRRAWGQSRESAGQAVLISGEPGIGKSRLVETLGAEAKEAGYLRCTVRCSPYHSNSALYPVIQYLKNALAWKREDTIAQKLAALEQALADCNHLPANSVQLLAALLALALPEERYPALTLSPQQQKQQTLDVLVAWMNDTAERQPSLWVWEDVHWADPSTLELLGLEIEQCPTAPILNVLTFRPDFIPPWSARSHLTPLTLNRLERAEIEAMIKRQSNAKALPADVVEHIVSKSDGVPLYVEELTKTIITAGFLHDTGQRYERVGSLSDMAIPATLQDSLMARLDRIPTARQVAQLGAIFGREFAYGPLRAIAALEEPVLRKSLEQLVGEEILYQRGRPPQARYMFKHALIQDMAYQSLLKRHRRQYHRQVAELLEKRFPELTETEPELLAQHYTEAGLVDQAISYWQRAGQRASERSAYQEAISHLTCGLDLLQSLPDSRARDQQELVLQTALAAALLIVRGQAAPEAEVAYTRALTLCKQLNNTKDSPLILFGLWRFYIARADFPMALRLAKELYGLAESSDETSLTVMAHYALSVNSTWSGKLNPGFKHAREAIAHYSIAQRSTPLFRTGQDPGVACRIFSAVTLWLLGYPEQALAYTRDALALGAELDDPISNAVGLDLASMVWQFRREEQNVYDHAEAAVALCTTQGFTIWLALGTALRGWALTAQGQYEEGLKHMQQGFTDWRGSGTELLVPYFLTLLSEGYSRLGRIEIGLKVLNEAEEVTLRTGQYWWQAEIYRRKGELQLQQASTNSPGAEICFQQALDIARQQQARSLELRAAISLARLWQQQRVREAYELLMPIYDWFTEGFDTADLKDAKALLEELV